MQTYTRTIGITGSHYTKTFEKIKHHKSKTRVIREEIVAKNFLAGDAEIIVYFEETEETFTVTLESDKDIIKKYLGPKFISY